MWQPIEYCPKNGTDFDVWAKTWISKKDEFIYKRFTNCYWRSENSTKGYGLEGVPDNWKATYWMPIPKGPE
jgi:hypothetical protein